MVYSAMATDLAIPRVAASRTGPDPVQGRGTDSTRPPTETKPRISGPSSMNPALKFDPTTGLVIMEFRDKAGEVSNSIPNKQQIEAYRRSADTTSGQTERTPSTRRP
jgi:hypothetical protein